jgi:hypothetical protein
VRSKPNKLYKESMKQKSSFFEKITKTDKPLANMTKWIREKTQINKIRDKKVDITTNTNEIQRIIREYFENLYSSKLENLDEMDKFLDTYIQTKLNQEDIIHLNSPITCSKIEVVIVSLQRRAQDLRDSWPNFTKHLKKN